jgi:hypothetical protein
MLGTMLVDVGIILIISGFVATFRHRVPAGHARRVFKLPESAIACGDTGRQSRITGRVVASDEGCLVAPCSGESAVWFRVRVRRKVARGRGGLLWATVAEEAACKAFYIDDDSGESARVTAIGAKVYVDMKTFEMSSPQVIERMGSFLGERGVGDVGADLFEEECLSPGDSVIVVGRLRRETGALRPSEYRDVASRELTIRSESGQELIVGTQASLRRERGGVHLIGQVAMAVGALAVMVGFIARWIVPE